MTRNDDFIGHLEGYLDEYEGSTPLPNDARIAIRAQLPMIRQIGLLRGPMRFLTMTMHVPAAAQYGLLAAAVVAAAVLGASFIGRNIGGPPDPTPTPLPVATPGALPAAGSLEPGTYVMANPYVDADPIFSADYQRITFTMPDGWATVDGLIYKHLDEPTEVALSVWTPGDIYLDPCRWQTSEVGPDTSAHNDNANGEIVLDDQYPLLTRWAGRRRRRPMSHSADSGPCGSNCRSQLISTLPAVTRGSSGAGLSGTSPVVPTPIMPPARSTSSTSSMWINARFSSTRRTCLPPPRQIWQSSKRSSIRCSSTGAFEWRGPPRRRLPTKERWRRPSGRLIERSRGSLSHTH